MPANDDVAERLRVAIDWLAEDTGYTPDEVSIALTRRIDADHAKEKQDKPIDRSGHSNHTT